MKTVHDLYQAVRHAFPAITQRADEHHIKHWGELNTEFAYSWFESLANALNDEISKERPYSTHKALFEFMSTTLSHAEKEVYQYIDVAFVENLFWQVPSTKCVSYWSAMPQSLRKLYLDFHQREP